MTTTKVSITDNKIEVTVDGVVSFLEFYEPIDESKIDGYVNELTYECMKKIQDMALINNTEIVTTYAINRLNKYPPIQEQLDMLWHAMDADANLRLEPFYSSIKEVKDQFPKE